MTQTARPGQHAGVQHMKWYGWGVEGIAFQHENKPKLAPFVRKAVGLDLDQPAVPPKTFDDLAIPESRADQSLLDKLADALGTEQVVTDPLDRLVHTYGKSIRDLYRIRQGDLPRVPDVIVYPADEAQVEAVVQAGLADDTVIIPFGGGSNIAGSLTPPDDPRPIISLDLGRLNQLLEIDEDSGLARIQAGTLGPDLEEQLGRRGWTLGHFPDSFTHSTLGGWVATRSSGMQSDKYGDIADICRGLRCVTPAGTLVLRPLPSTSTGPSVREMILGSEGRLGVITEVTVQVHRIPEERLILGYLFPNWTAGLKAMHEIARSDIAVSVTRVSDANESAFSFATGKKSKGVSKYATKAMMTYLEKKGWNLDDLCLSFIGYEGNKAHVARQKSLVKSIISKHGGVVAGKGPGALYDQKKFDTPYIRDFLLDRGAMADVSETAAPWSKLADLYDRTVAAAHRAYAEIGVEGWVMCHLSHSYHSGACLYFTFAFVAQQDALGEYDQVKRAIQQSFVDNDGTLSHHHAVGVEHAPWMSEDISPAGVRIMQGLFSAVDPAKNLNPGKIVD
ncbi:MAG: FAD-binding oxidoreductase [Propionibacteriaceae bacterium]